MGCGPQNIYHLHSVPCDGGENGEGRELDDVGGDDDVVGVEPKDSDEQKRVQRWWLMNEGDMKKEDQQ